MASQASASKRRRVQVDLSEGDWQLLGRAISGNYHRGKHLRELMVLGLAAEMSGLSYAMEGGIPTLKGRGAILLGLGNEALAARPEGGAASDRVSPKQQVEEPQAVVMPTGFMEQF